MSSTKRSYRWLFWLLALIGFAADQATKYSIFAWLYSTTPGAMTTDGRAICQNPVVVVSGYFHLVARYTDQPWEGDGLLHYLRTISGPNRPILNPGALFGIGAGTDFGNYFFLAVSLAAALAIIIWSTRPSAGRDGYLCFALGLILAGTLGNFYDRVVFGGVRDFLHAFNLPLPFGLDDWPVFNLADCCLVCGAILLVLEAVLRKPVHDAQPQESAAVTNETHGLMANRDCDGDPIGVHQ